MTSPDLHDHTSEPEAAQTVSSGGAPPPHLAQSSPSASSSVGSSSGSSSESSAQMNEALKVLDQALDELADQQRQPTASQVRLAMKRLTYGGFEPQDLGFKRFRDFLETAARDKRIELFDRPGDVLVARRGAPPVSDHVVRIRRDLWKTALDWSADVAHYLDLDTDKVVTVPSVPVPLEPEKFANLRTRIAAKDERLVRVPSIDIHTQVGWMAQFARSVDEPEVEFRLERALSSPKSAREFARVLRSEPEVRYVWNRQLSAHVLVHLLRWKSEDPRLLDVQIDAGVERADEPTPDEEPTQGAVTDVPTTPQPDEGSIRMYGGGAVGVVPTPQRDASVPSQARVLAGAHVHETTRVPRVVSYGSRIAETPVTGTPRLRERRSRLRLALHRAIDRMPEEELAKLVIPVGYLIED